MWGDKKICQADLERGRVTATPMASKGMVIIKVGREDYSIQCDKWKLLCGCVNEVSENGMGGF